MGTRQGDESHRAAQRPGPIQKQGQLNASHNEKQRIEVNPRIGLERQKQSRVEGMQKKSSVKQEDRG